ncbi:MAG: phosphate ABC transporter permease PstA [Dehalococcoidia bacterium]|nr:phosphate ABC transporter permease PstA [Dehalococcoidia bacterium]
MNFRSHRWRKAKNLVMMALMVACVVVALVPLVSILGYVAVRGGSALNVAFLTQLPKPVGEVGGGMANAMVGTLILLGLACCVSLPVGILAGVHLAEFGHGWFSSLVRFTTEVLTGIPSITIGIFVYTVIVLPMRSFSAIAGGIALGIIMVPTVTRTTEEMLRLVPRSLREGAWALGIPRWRAIISVVIPTAAGGIVTGILLAIARVAGETAPLLFTALGNRFWHSSLGQPIAALTLQVFAYSISPYDDWQAQAWAGAFVLTTMVLILSVAVRVVVRGRNITTR